MPDIHVDTAALHQEAERLRELAAQLSALGAGVVQSGASAPSYDAQFGSKVASLAGESDASLRVQVNALSELADSLEAKAAAFEEADRAAAMATGQTIEPFYWATLASILDWLPPWLREALISMIPLGDSIGILRQLSNWLTSEDVDELDLGLSVLGLGLDLVGSPFGPDDAGVAVLKGLAHALPPGPARDGLAELVEGMLKNSDEAVAAGKAAGEIAKRPAVLNAFMTHSPEALVSLLKAGPDAVDEILAYSDDVITRHLDEISDLDMAKVDLPKGLSVTNKAQELGVDIRVTGAWSDTAAEKALREDAFGVAKKRALELAEERGLIIDGEVPDEVLDDLIEEVKPAVADEFGIDTYQVKVSTGDPEVDVFIPDKQWAGLSRAQKNDLTDELIRVFDVEDVDYYQINPPKLGYPDPKTRIPPGSIHFGPDGAVTHDLLGGLGSP